MYKAIHAASGEEIIILSPAWKKKIDRLRELDHQDLLLCQGCLQPLRVKAGERRRTHFAHKHLKACSYGSESPEILNARAVLYDWLVTQFGDAATLEKWLPGAALPRPVDGWVETEAGHLAYWIIESGIRLEARRAIQQALKTPDVRAHWVFLSKMLNEEKKEFQSVLLTPTERAFLQTTTFDEIEAGMGPPGGTLHYLDAEQKRLTTYRALTLFHRPNWFRGIKRSDLLDDIHASRIDGEMVHPGEITRRNTIRERKMRRERKLEHFKAREINPQDRLIVERKADPLPPARRIWDRLPPQPVEEPAALPCATCGQVTTDYWSTFYDYSGRKLCRCRDCLAREE